MVETRAELSDFVYLDRVIWDLIIEGLRSAGQGRNCSRRIVRFGIDMDSLKSLVIRARAGDLDAYGEVVVRFQDMANGYAYSLLGDFHLAEDAAQEAFIEAFGCLANLREPAAFPGWFRRIVFKHCDRLTRRKGVATLPMEAASAVASRRREPVELAEEREMKEAVLDAIRSLPEHERTAATLYYINGYSQGDIAGFLEVPRSTIKNRLASSRKRLRERMVTMVSEELQAGKPGPEQRKAIIDELMFRKAEFDRIKWKADSKWADWWHGRRMKDVRANAASYGIEADESMPRMLAEYQAMHTFRDDFKEIPRRWGVPEGTTLVFLRDLCREVAAAPVAVHRWAAEGLPVLRYHPWSAYDESRAQKWIAERGIRPDERISGEQAREPLLATLRGLARGEVSIEEARGVLAGLETSRVRCAADCGEGRDPEARELDPLWDQVWRARRAGERLDNARRYGLAEPTDDWLGVPQEMLDGRVFEIRDLCRRLCVSPFDVIRWTGEGMPALRHSPWVRWDVEHVAAWIAEHHCLPTDKHTPRELDVLEDFVLPAIADGHETPEDGREIFTCWMALM